MQDDRGAGNVTTLKNITDIPLSAHSSMNISQISAPSSSTNLSSIGHSSSSYLPQIADQSSSTSLPSTSDQSSSSLSTIAAHSLSTNLSQVSDKSTTRPPVSTQSSPSPVVFVTTGKESVPYIKTMPKKSQCLTWAGPEKGLRCVFPFTYRNKTFDGCTEFWRQKSWWCATKVDSRGGDTGQTPALLIQFILTSASRWQVRGLISCVCSLSCLKVFCTGAALRMKEDTGVPPW